MAFYFYYAALKLIILGSLAFFLIENSDFNFNLILLNVLSLGLMYFCVRKVYSEKVEKRNKKKLITKNQLTTVRLTIFVALLCVLFAYAINGFPALMLDVNAAKVGLSNNPILMRGLRFIVPGLIFVRMWLYYSHANAKIESRDIYIFAFACVITILSGYKGYFLNYIIMPMAISYFLYSTGKVKIAKILFTLMLIICVVIVNIMINEGEGILEASKFLLIRATYSQVEGAIHILSNIDYYYNISPFFENINFLISKLDSDGPLLNFNATVFKDIQGDNPLGMQVSIPNFIELFVDGGVYLMILGVIFELLMIIFVLKSIRKSVNPIVLALLYMAVFYLVDISINGAAILKLIDYTFSAIFFLIIFYFSKIILYILYNISSSPNN